MGRVTEPMRTALHTAHDEAGGRFTTFAGWRMPVHYGSILREARAVRGEAGMFDVSHMGRLRVRGPDALDVLQSLGTNDLGKVRPGKAQYTVWCTSDGGTIDDLIVLWLDEEDFLVVVNAARRPDDLEHLEARAEGREATVVDDTQATVLIAVQGPTAVEVVSSLGAEGIEELPSFGIARTDVDGAGAIVSRTGYTGEDGVEICCDAGAGPRVWEALRTKGVAPCGLGARDALRMEVGFPLYGHELGPDISPLEAGLGFAVALDKPDFTGKGALEKLKADGVPRRLRGFVCERPCVPQQGDEIGPGTVTSGGTSVVLDAPIGLCFVPRDAAEPGSATLRTRGKEIPCEIRKLPLIDRSRPIAKSS